MGEPNSTRMNLKEAQIFKLKRFVRISLLKNRGGGAGTVAVKKAKEAVTVLGDQTVFRKKKKKLY